MPVLRIGLIVAGVGFLYVSAASWRLGFPPEVSFTRGIVAFMAMALVAYLGELVIATAVPRDRAGERDRPAGASRASNKSSTRPPEGGGGTRGEAGEASARSSAGRQLPAGADRRREAA